MQRFDHPGYRCKLHDSNNRLALLGCYNQPHERGAVKDLETLAAYQAPNGQIPKFVAPDRREADFWYLGCIDATLWWLIALALLGEHLGGRDGRRRLLRRYRHEVALALRWLGAQEHQRFFLLQQNEASDWADIMPRSGFADRNFKGPVGRRRPAETAP